MKSAPAVAILTLSLAGCGSLLAPDPLPLRVVASHLVASADPSGPLLTLAYEIMNDGGEELYVLSCGGEPRVEVEREVGGEWVQVSSAHCLTHLDMSPITLAPGGGVTGTRLIVEPGSYRVIGFGSRQIDGPPVRVTSNVVIVGTQEP